MMRRFLRSIQIKGIEKGQDLAEYAILFGLIALVAVFAVSVLGVNISSVFSNLAADFSVWF